jgi:hypothetical protein
MRTPDDLNNVEMVMMSHTAMSNAYYSTYKTDIPELYVFVRTGRNKWDGMANNRVSTSYAYRGKRYGKAEDVLTAINEYENKMEPAQTGV